MNSTDIKVTINEYDNGQLCIESDGTIFTMERGVDTTDDFAPLPDKKHSILDSGLSDQLEIAGIYDKVELVDHKYPDDDGAYGKRWIIKVNYEPGEYLIRFKENGEPYVLKSFEFTHKFTQVVEKVVRFYADPVCTPIEVLENHWDNPNVKHESEVVPDDEQPDDILSTDFDRDIEWLDSENNVISTEF